jgi:hypothetical protein
MKSLPPLTLFEEWSSNPCTHTARTDLETLFQVEEFITGALRNPDKEVARLALETYQELTFLSGSYQVLCGFLSQALQHSAIDSRCSSALIPLPLPSLRALLQARAGIDQNVHASRNASHKF